VILAISDTHAESTPEFTPHLRDAIERADCVLHAGDFTTERALDAVGTVAGDLRAVAGNRDATAVRDRLPEQRVVDQFGRRFLLVHGHQHNPTSLGLLARQEGADVAVVGHTHEPVIETSAGLTVVNPGSHADPRGHRPAYAAIEAGGDSVRARLRTVTGREFGSTRL